jgi:hypothetical protein
VFVPENGFSDVITIVEGRIEELSDEQVFGPGGGKADIIISEWMVRGPTPTAQQHGALRYATAVLIEHAVAMAMTLRRRHACSLARSDRC